MSSKLDTAKKHWLLRGRANAGKSSLAASLTPEFLALDYDNRWADNEEAMKSSHMIVTTNIVEAAEKAYSLLPLLKGKVGTVIHDSVTTILDYTQALGRMRADDAKAAGGKFNIETIHRQKADTMRIMRGIGTMYAANVIYVAHFDDTTKSGQTGLRSTISNTEIDRLRKDLTAMIEVFRDQKSGKHGVKIEWCRFNVNPSTGKAPADGLILWDHVGKWAGFADKLDFLMRNYQGTEGFTGQEYSIEWLYRFLEGKGKKFDSIDKMVKELELSNPPMWYDRNSWGEILKMAGAM